MRKLFYRFDFMLGYLKFQDRKEDVFSWVIFSQTFHPSCFLDQKNISTNPKMNLISEKVSFHSQLEESDWIEIHDGDITLAECC